MPKPSRASLQSRSCASGWSAGAGPGGILRRGLRAGLFGTAFAAHAVFAAAAPPLSLEGVTFVLAEEAEAELLLTAASATLDRSGVARLQDVRVVLAADESHPRFEARCPEGRLDLGSRSFDALGPVEGRTGDGRRFRAQSLRYRDPVRRFESDDPVSIVDASGRIEAGGLRYSLDDRSLRLLRGTRVEAAP